MRLKTARLSLKKLAKLADVPHIFILATALTLASCQPSGQHSKIPLRSADKIIGGVVASNQDAFASTTVILFNTSEEALCTASILSDSTLITAAHCVDGAPTDLRVMFSLDANSDTAPIQQVVDTRVPMMRAVRESELHDSGDVALVKFTGGLPPGFHAVQLLADAMALKDGASIILAGYGILNSATHEGAGTLRSVQTTIRAAAYSSSEVEVEQNQGKGSCHGDSGGPAFITANGTSYLFGVTSRGADDPSDTCGVAAVYTNLVYYQNWIRQTQAEFANENF